MITSGPCGSQVHHSSIALWGSEAGSEPAAGHPDREPGPESESPADAEEQADTEDPADAEEQVDTEDPADASQGGTAPAEDVPRDPAAPVAVPQGQTAPAGNMPGSPAGKEQEGLLQARLIRQGRNPGAETAEAIGSRRSGSACWWFWPFWAESTGTGFITAIRISCRERGSMDIIAAA